MNVCREDVDALVPESRRLFDAAANGDIREGMVVQVSGETGCFQLQIANLIAWSLLNQRNAPMFDLSTVRRPDVFARMIGADSVFRGHCPVYVVMYDPDNPELWDMVYPQLTHAVTFLLIEEADVIPTLPAYHFRWLTQKETVRGFKEVMAFHKPKRKVYSYMGVVLYEYSMGCPELILSTIMLNMHIIKKGDWLMAVDRMPNDRADANSLYDLLTDCTKDMDTEVAPAMQKFLENNHFRVGAKYISKRMCADALTSPTNASRLGFTEIMRREVRTETQFIALCCDLAMLARRGVQNGNNTLRA